MFTTPIEVNRQLVQNDKSLETIADFYEDILSNEKGISEYFFEDADVYLIIRENIF